MKVSISHVAASLLLVATIATAGTAQQLPTAQQAQQMLQNPDLVSQLRQQLTTSGLTPDQVRARLTAEGYPATLLDAYLPGGNAGARDSLPGDDVFNAMRALGVSAVYPNSTRHFGKRRFTSQRRVVGWKRIDADRMDAAISRLTSSRNKLHASRSRR